MLAVLSYNALNYSLLSPENSVREKTNSSKAINFTALWDFWQAWQIASLEKAESVASQDVASTHNICVWMDNLKSHSLP